eukprot:TRINITY_DN16214_c0_g1_i3.p1 TRINITY_DN16214_c0_g1~~TRINITY_DN16214_c0_g1_i3.p1  ORF type:complete len:101 (-),score=20.16 TRINITY_DN16214_c0_g1_i3:12-314(-)
MAKVTDRKQPRNVGRLLLCVDEIRALTLYTEITCCIHSAAAAAAGRCSCQRSPPPLLPAATSDATAAAAVHCNSSSREPHFTRSPALAQRAPPLPYAPSS